MIAHSISERREQKILRTRVKVCAAVLSRAAQLLPATAVVCLNCNGRHQPANADQFLAAFYSFAIVHCAHRTETEPINKGGGGKLTKRVGGITKYQSAETRASDAH